MMMPNHGLNRIIFAASRKSSSSFLPVLLHPFPHPIKNPSHIQRANIACTTAQHVSCARNFAVGKLDMDWVLPYSRLISEDAVNYLNEYASRVEAFYHDCVNSVELDKNGVISDDIMLGLKDLGLFGLLIPTKYGGKGLGNLESLRLFEEISRDHSINAMLRAHQIEGIQAILLAGTEEQKTRYLSKLATGEWIAALCLTEKASGSDIAAIECEARLSDDGKHWILNGEKHWVVNGGIADVLTVFAKTQVVDLDNKVIEKTTAFVIERSFGGVTSERIETLGLKAADICNVTFEDTMVPVENVLGEVGNGFQLAVSSFNCGRVGIGANVATQLKSFVALATDHNSRFTRFGRCLSEHPLMQRKVWQMAVNAYACESMAYMTAFQMDQENEKGEPRDCSVEAAIVKVFSAERAWQSINDFMEIIGTDACDCSYPYERLLRDAKALSLLEGTHDTLRLYISLASLQHAAVKVKDRIKAFSRGSFRERMTVGLDAFSEILRLLSKDVSVPAPSNRRIARSQTKSWLDPSLSDMGKAIEQLLSLYQHTAFSQLRHRGKYLEKEQQKLSIFADVSINIFAMTAVLSRCNKAVLLNMRNSDHERLLAFAFIKQTYKDTWLLLDQASTNYAHEYVAFETKASQEMTEERRYLCAHPLEVKHKYIEHPKYIEQLTNLKAQIAA